MGGVSPSEWADEVLRALGIGEQPPQPAAMHPLQYLSPSGLIDLLEAFLPQATLSVEPATWVPADAGLLAEGLEDTMATLANVSPNALSAVAGTLCTLSGCQWQCHAAGGHWPVVWKLPHGCASHLST